jgi:hypothetical protein
METNQKKGSTSFCYEIDYKIDWMKRKIKEYEEAKENRDSIDENFCKITETESYDIAQTYMDAAEVKADRLEAIINKAIKIEVVDEFSN